MTYLEWSDDLDTGIAVIDDQHKRIVAMINQLDDAQRTANKVKVGTVIDELIDYTVSHFAFEEAMAGAFENNCAQCHRADLGGNIGPNLTDDHWKNVKSPVDIVRVISEGVPGTAMTAWKNRFREPQIMLIAAYVASRRGSGPPNPKAAEGVVIEAWDRWSDEAPGSTDVGSGS